MADLLPHLLGAMQVGPDEQDYELITAIAGRHISTPHRPPHDPGRQLQHLVALFMAVPVVDVLEVVQINEQHGKRDPSPARSRHLLLQTVPQHSESGEPRQLVHRGLLLGLPSLSLLIWRALPEVGPPLDLRHGELAAGAESTGATVPMVPPWSSPDPLDDTGDLLLTNALQPVDRRFELGPYVHLDVGLQNRLRAPGWLQRRLHLPPVVQLLGWPQEGVVQTPLTRQQVHKPQVDLVHRDRPSDHGQMTQPPQLPESAAGVALLL